MTIRELGFRAFVLTAVVATALSACRPAPSPTPPLAADIAPSLPEEAEVRRSAATGVLERVRGDDLAAAIEQSRRFRESRANGDYRGMALAFLDAYRSEFELEDPSGELSVSRVNADGLGFHQVRFNQAYRGLPVLDAELIVHFDPDDRIYLAEGRYLPTPTDVSTNASLSEQEARRRLSGATGDDAAIATGELAILLPSESAPARPVYRFEVRSGLTDRREVLLDANTGRTLRSVPLVLNGR